MAKVPPQEIGPEKKPTEIGQMKHGPENLQQSSFIGFLDIAARPFQPSVEWEKRHTQEAERKERLGVLNDAREARFNLLKEMSLA